MKHVCPNCPKRKRKSRDILKKGECYWYKNWTSGKLTIPVELLQFAKLNFLRKPAKIRIGNKVYTIKPPKR